MSRRKKIKVFEAFSGVRMQKMALDKLQANENVEFEYVGTSEIDEHAIKSSRAIHGDDMNYGDISKIDVMNLPSIDLFTYSFPCQDVSTAGKGKGIQEGTRSGLLFEVERIIIELKNLGKLPRFLFMENVEGLLSAKHIAGYEKWRDYLSEIGYTNTTFTLNSKDYGIPQNRRRVFMISDLQETYYYEPTKHKLKTSLKDLLCDFDDKYFLKQEFVDRFRYMDNKHIVGTTRIENKQNNISPAVHDSDEYVSCLTATDWKRPHQVLIRENTSKGYVEAVDGDGIILDNPKSKTKRGRIQQQCSPTLLTSCQVGVITYGKYAGMRIKKLSPKECWRLMGINDEYFEKAARVCSDTQLYRQAGNGIVIDVMYGLFYKMFIKNENENAQMQLW